MGGKRREPDGHSKAFSSKAFSSHSTPLSCVMPAGILNCCSSPVCFSTPWLSDAVHLCFLTHVPTPPLLPQVERVHLSRVAAKNQARQQEAARQAVARE